MIKSKKDLKEFLKEEKKLYIEDNGNLLRNIIMWLFPFLEEKRLIWNFQKKLRKYEYHLNLNNKIRQRIINFSLSRKANKLGFHIPPNCFDKGLTIRHIGSILVNKKAKIGKNCVLHINTAIVASGEEGKTPIIGNNCVLGIGSIVLGGIILGDNITIGAGAVVNKSFESNIVIAGVPAKIIKTK